MLGLWWLGRDDPRPLVAVVEGADPGNDGSVRRSSDPHLIQDAATTSRFRRPVRWGLGYQPSVGHVGIDGYDQRVDAQVPIGPIHDLDAGRWLGVSEDRHAADNRDATDPDQPKGDGGDDRKSLSDLHGRNRTPQSGCVHRETA